MVDDNELEFLMELQETFLAEMAEHLEANEALFIDFEQNPQNQDIIEDIFRRVHTIKGSARAAGFMQLSDFTHVFEDLLVKLKKKEIKASDTTVDVLLEANDRLKLFADHLNQDKNANIAVDDVIEKLRQELSPKSRKKSKKKKVEEESVEFGFFDDDDPPATAEATPAPTPQSVDRKPRALEKGRQQDEVIRLSLSKLDHLLDCFGEQVILQASLEEAKKDLVSNAEMINKTVSQLGKITYDLQHAAMSLRMVPMSGLFNQIRRTVRDTAKAVSKAVRVQVRGEETELDKAFVDQLTGAVNHLIRNALDHGIEDAAERKKTDKDEVATVFVHAYQNCGFFFLDIHDDGRGIDPDKIKAKAVDAGLISADTELSKEEIYQLLFRSGFSTAKKVTDVSGRGVGMDAVMDVVHSLRGEIMIHSNLGRGTTVTIKLPLNMAIFNGIVFQISGERYVLPSTDIAEVYRFQDQDVTQLKDGRSLLVKGEETITLLDARKTIRVGEETERNNKRQVAFIIEREGAKVALRIDEVIGQNRIVQKKLGHEIEQLPGVSGGAILGDGTVALVLNVNNLMGH